jgi:hypothetical protein
MMERERDCTSKIISTTDMNRSPRIKKNVKIIANLIIQRLPQQYPTKKSPRKRRMAQKKFQITSFFFSIPYFLMARWMSSVMFGIFSRGGDHENKRKGGD